MMFTFRVITTLLVHTFIALVILGLLCKYFHLLDFFLIKWRAFLLSIELKSCDFKAKWSLRESSHPAPPSYVWEDRPWEDRGAACVSQMTPSLSSLLHYTRKWACQLSDLVSIKRQFQCLLKDFFWTCTSPISMSVPTLSCKGCDPSEEMQALSWGRVLETVSHARCFPIRCWIWGHPGIVGGGGPRGRGHFSAGLGYSDF